MPTVYLAPDPINSTQFIPGGNTPAAGAKLFHYLAGTSTKADVYVDNTGVGKWTNPIVLDSGGNLGGSNEVWQPAGIPLKYVLAPSNDTDPPVSPYWSRDNLSGVGDPTSFTEWIPSGLVPTFVSATSFTVTGDQTLVLTPGRRLKTTNTSGTIYSTVVSSIFGILTTVTVTNDSGTLDAGLSTVSYGFINPKNTSLPLIVSVVNFGAKGDGVTDDTAAIQAALTFANNNDRTCFFPAGNYLISSSLSLTWSGVNVRLVGETAGISSGSSQGAVLTFSGSGALFTYNGSATPTSFECEFIKFRCTNAGAQTFGIKLNQSNNNLIRGCIFEGFSFTNSACIYTTGATNSVITHIDDCCFGTSYMGVFGDKTSTNSLKITNNTFNGCSQHAIRLGDFAAGAMSSINVVIVGNTFESTTATSDIHSTGGLINALIDGNYFEWTGNKIPITIDTNGASGVSQSVTLRNLNFSGSLAAASQFTSVANIDGLIVEGIAQLSNLAATQFLVKKTSGNLTNYRIQRPSVVSGNTAVATYNDGTTTYTDQLFSDIIPSLSSWTPNDASGASLSLTLNGTQPFYKMGKTVTVFFDISYPATADGSNAKLGGLPFTSGNFNYTGAFGIQSSAQSLGFYVPSGTTQIQPVKLNTGGTPPTNANLTAARLTGSVSYTTA